MGHRLLHLDLVLRHLDAADLGLLLLGEEVAALLPCQEPAVALDEVLVVLVRVVDDQLGAVDVLDALRGPFALADVREARRARGSAPSPCASSPWAARRSRAGTFA